MEWGYCKVCAWPASHDPGKREGQALSQRTLHVVRIWDMRKVLFVCVHNSGRSQMAEAFFNRLARGKALALSAGTMPAKTVNPVVAQAMQEAGFSLASHTPKLLTEEMLEGAERVFTMGCSVEEVCPATLVPTEDWGLPDPSGKPLDEVRAIREDIRARVRVLVKEMGL